TVGGLSGYAFKISTSGVLDAGFPVADGIIRAVIPDGSGGWYVGGTFTNIGGQPRNRIAHIDASNNVTAWNPNANNGVYTMVLSGTTLYVGGLLTNIGGQNRNRIAALDTTVNTNNATAWNPNAGSTVNALALSRTT